jgi:RNA polymerase sigma-70 factor, ECF subfamily
MLELIIAARNGSKPAMGQLLEHFRPLLRSVARQELPQMLAGKVEPSSVVQETCADAYKDISKMRATTEEEWQAWLMQILRMNIYDALRRFLEAEKRDVHREVPLYTADSNPLIDQLVASGLSPEGQAESREDRERLEAALVRLPEPLRQIIEWVGRDRLSFVQIAEMTDSTPDAVRMKYHRGVARVAKELSRDDQ